MQILNIPFDEPVGSSIAFDYSASRHDVTIPAGASFVRGKSGNALSITSEGYVDSLLSPSFLSGDYAIKFRGKILQGPSATSKVTIYIYSLTGLDNEITITGLMALTSRSCVVVVTKISQTVTVYLDGVLLWTSGEFPGSFGGISGFALLNYNGTGQGGYMQIEDWEMHTGPLDVNSLLFSGQKIDFLLNGVNFNYWDVRVTEMAGVIDNLTPKEPTLKAEWTDYHGEIVDLSKPRYQPREITLDCYIKADGKYNFHARFQEFFAELTKPGTQRLQINLLNETKPFVFEIGPPDGSTLKTRWRPEVQYGTFQLKLKEYEPVKRVLKWIRSGESTKTASITLSSSKMLTIYWGDGSRTDNAYGTNVTYAHDYAADGEYFIIVAGVIEEITAFTTNAIIVWSRLS